MPHNIKNLSSHTHSSVTNANITGTGTATGNLVGNYVSPGWTGATTIAETRISYDQLDDELKAIIDKFEKCIEEKTDRECPKCERSGVSFLKGDYVCASCRVG
jgi:hypothetical protein